MASSESPHADRPHLPGYGIEPGPDGLLPWSWAVERLRDSRRYWVSTTAADGAPHVAAVWAIWFDDELVFSTGGASAKARNLARDPRCAVACERADESVVLRGTVRRITDPERIAAITAVYVSKYGSGFPDPAESPLFAVQPVDVIAVIEAEDRFTSTATRWTFAP